MTPAQMAFEKRKARLAREKKTCEGEDEEEVEVRCLCDVCHGEGKCYVSKQRAKELEQLNLMEECCPFGDNCAGEEGESETCEVCGFVETPGCGSDQLVGLCEKCKRHICDHCRATDVLNGVEVEVHEVEDFGYDAPVCQACYDARDDWMPEGESETCARCEKTFRYYLHDATCDDCSSYFVCKDCEMLMEGCGICGK